MISACMTVSVRELRTAVREWACWEEDVIFCLLPVGVCIDAYVTIRIYVLCVSTH